jgi:hypothetical protein
VCYVDRCTLFGCRMFWDQVVVFMHAGRQTIMPSFFVAIATYMKVAFFSNSFLCIGVLWDLHSTFLQVTWKFCKFLSFWKWCNLYQSLSSYIFYFWTSIFELMCWCASKALTCVVCVNLTWVALGKTLQDWSSIPPQVLDYIASTLNSNLLVLLVAKIVHKTLYIC